MHKQIPLLKKEKSEYGGELLKTRGGRKGPRPLSTDYSMHLVLRSSLAKGNWSFKNPRNEREIKKIIKKFSLKNGVKIISYAIVGNHIHLQIKLSNRYTYNRFIRAIAAAIMMAVTGVCRWRPSKEKFWDLRPFSRIVESLRAVRNLENYIYLNRIEAAGFSRSEAREILRREGRARPAGFVERCPGPPAGIVEMGHEPSAGFVERCPGPPAGIVEMGHEPSAGFVERRYGPTLFGGLFEVL